MGSHLKFLIAVKGLHHYQNWRTCKPS